MFRNRNSPSRLTLSERDIPLRKNDKENPRDFSKRTPSGTVIKGTHDDPFLPPLPYPVQTYSTCSPRQDGRVVFGISWSIEDDNGLDKLPRMHLPSPTKNSPMKVIFSDIAPVSLIRHSAIMKHYTAPLSKGSPSVIKEDDQTLTIGLYIPMTSGFFKFTGTSILPYRLSREFPSDPFYVSTELKNFQDNHDSPRLEETLIPLPLDVLGVCTLPIVMPMNNRVTFTMQFLVVENIFPLDGPGSHDIDMAIDVAAVGSGAFWTHPMGVTPVVERGKPRLHLSDSGMIELITAGVLKDIDGTERFGKVGVAVWFGRNSIFNQSATVDVDLGHAQYAMMNAEDDIVQLVALTFALEKVGDMFSKLGVVTTGVNVAMPSKEVVRLMGKVGEQRNVPTKPGWGWLNIIEFLRRLKYKIAAEYLDLQRWEQLDEVVELAREGPKQKNDSEMVYEAEEVWIASKLAEKKICKWVGHGLRVGEKLLKDLEGVGRWDENKKSVHEIVEAGWRVRGYPPFLDIGKMRKRLEDAVPGVFDVLVGLRNGDLELVFTPEVVYQDVGQQVRFQFYPQNHSVAQSSLDRPCAPLGGASSAVGFFSGFNSIDSTDQTIPTFTINITSTEPVYFYCAQGRHCQGGMVGIINPPSADAINVFKAAASKVPFTEIPLTPPQDLPSPKFPTTSFAGLSRPTTTGADPGYTPNTPAAKAANTGGLSTSGPTQQAHYEELQRMKAEQKRVEQHRKSLTPGPSRSSPTPPAPILPRWKIFKKSTYRRRMEVREIDIHDSSCNRGYLNTMAVLLPYLNLTDHQIFISSVIPCTILSAVVLVTGILSLCWPQWFGKRCAALTPPVTPAATQASFPDLDDADQGSSILASITIERIMGLLFLRSRISPIIPSPEKTLLPKLSSEEQAGLAYHPGSLPGGRWLQTPTGRIRVYEFGPEDGKRVLFVHGISTPSIVARDMLTNLARKGCRIIAFDLPGRGYSECCKITPHDMRLYSALILMVTTSSTAPGGFFPFNIIGYSLGGGITVSFASQFPHLISSIVVLSSAGLLPYSMAPFGLKCCLQPWVPVWLVDRLLSTQLKGEEEAPIDFPVKQAEPKTEPLDIFSVIRWQNRYQKGFISSYINSMRNGPIFDRVDEWESVGRFLREGKFAGRGGKMLVFYGEKDDLTPPVLLNRVVACVGEDQVKSVIVEDGTHEIIVYQWDRILEEVVDFWGL
ncbi:hypothetical protein Dda_8730 [Drechslerella dactyloides]|uniref:AB hydrolase-1 domain-containing protein n=1 Tax=Drechslerella dactyloides TaxID=74499 RepID=A0AAD6ISL5_DREDA|nr:hypothetical protein Dda_8730 [Drechslerella dactyloides]